VLQCAAVCCSVLQCAAVCCSVLQCVAVCCSVLQCVAVCCSVMQCVAVSEYSATQPCRSPQDPYISTTYIYIYSRVYPQKSPIHLPTSAIYFCKRAQYISAKQPYTSLQKSSTSAKQPYIYLQKSPIYLLNSAIYQRSVPFARFVRFVIEKHHASIYSHVYPQKSLCISAKEPYKSAKERCIYEICKRALYISAKEPYKSAKERHISEIHAFCEICA